MLQRKMTFRWLGEMWMCSARASLSLAGEFASKSSCRHLFPCKGPCERNRLQSWALHWPACCTNQTPATSTQKSSES